MRNTHRLSLVLATALLSLGLWAADAATTATVSKPSVEVRRGPDFKTPAIATLAKDASVTIAAQQGLWFKVQTADGKTGFVRVNDVRMAYAKAETAGIGKTLFSGKAGKGRVSETASVRGLDESDLKAAAFDAEQLQLMESYRVEPAAAEKAARARHWPATEVAYAAEFRPGQAPAGPQATQAEKRQRFGIARNLLGMVKPGLADAADGGEEMIGKSEQEITEQELELGPLIAGRILGAAPLVADPAAQRRINLVGRWLASRTSRPDLPWTFGVIESDEVNAFAAPGGYVLVTRGLYQLLADDAELAAVLGHELSHVVQRDHYEVVRKQETQGALGKMGMKRVKAGGVAGSLAKDYVAKHGAAVMMTKLDRDAEFRADEAAGIYLARGGSNPLALYAVLQKMTALGTSSPKLTQLYRTHPPLDARMDRIDQRGYAGLEAYTKR
ncbi:M48 family metalloprotease [Thermomonas aquatica]|mgnify:FL=1|nr:M48 family metalloprotease [Thermomonas aquatica]